MERSNLTMKLTHFQKIIAQEMSGPNSGKAKNPCQRDKDKDRLLRRERKEESWYKERRVARDKDEGGERQQLSMKNKRKANKKVADAAREEENLKERGSLAEQSTVTAANKELHWAKKRKERTMGSGGSVGGISEEAKMKTRKKSPRVASDDTGCRHYGLMELGTLEKKDVNYYCASGRYLDGKNCRDCRKEILLCGRVFFCNEGLKAHTCEEEDKKYLAGLQCSFVICDHCRTTRLDSTSCRTRQRKKRGESSN